jgi:hypothetical protein
VNRRALVAWSALAIVMVAGCTVSQSPYAVEAVAQLAPVGMPEVRITGPIEILGTGTPGMDVDFVRTIAAYRVQLPDGAAPWVRLYTAASCDPEPAPMLYEHLGTIRRVGDEAHFISTDVIGDRTVDIDVQTVTAAVSSDDGAGDEFGKIAVVQAAEDGDGTILETISGNPVPAGGPWLACGTFVAP